MRSLAATRSRVAVRGSRPRFFPIRPGCLFCVYCVWLLTATLYIEPRRRAYTPVRHNDIPHRELSHWLILFLLAVTRDRIAFIYRVPTSV